MTTKTIEYYLHKNENQSDLQRKEGFKALVEVFHENTKLTTATKPFLAKSISHHLSNSAQIYLDSRNKKKYIYGTQIKLPVPTSFTMTLEDAFEKRASKNKFRSKPLDIQHISDILSSLRVTRSGVSKFNEKAIIHRRTYASAGALFPVEIYIFYPENDYTSWTCYNYDPQNHTLASVSQDIPTKTLAQAMQLDVPKTKCGAIIALSGIFNRSVDKYGTIGYRFSLIEAGGIIQQLGLAGASLQLQTLTWGGALDDHINDLLKADGLNENYLISFMIGY